MSYYSCYKIMDQGLNIDGRIDGNGRNAKLCCERLPKGKETPGVSFEGTAEEILDDFLALRQDIIDYSIKEGDKAKDIGENEWLGCKYCDFFQKENWEPKPFINYVNLSVYPAPCQCNCCYCTVDRHWDNTNEIKIAYEKLFNVLELADSRKIISPDAQWQISSGEITIHPYKQRFYKLAEKRKANFYTNGFIFDKELARILESNPKAKINISVDAGTPETWKRVKGFDNYKEVYSNLVDYHKASSHSGQIELKYIVLPGINDSKKDYNEFIKLMKKLEVSRLIIARDTGTKYSISKKERLDLLKSTVRLIDYCYRNNIEVKLSFFSEKEEQGIFRRNKIKKIKRILSK